MRGATLVEFNDKYRFWLCQGEHTGLNSWLSPMTPIDVGVVMVGGFPTRWDPRALFVVSVVAAKELPTKWGPIAHLAVSV